MTPNYPTRVMRNMGIPFLPLAFEADKDLPQPISTMSCKSRDMGLWRRKSETWLHPTAEGLCLAVSPSSAFSKLILYTLEVLNSSTVEA